MKHTNEQGFGLIALMMELGLISMTVMMLTSASAYSTRTNRAMLISSDMMTFLNQVRKNLDYDAVCSPSLTGNNIDQAIQIKDPLDPTKILAREGLSQQNGAWSVSKIRLNSILALPNQPNLMRGTLSMDLTRDMNQSVGSQILSKTVADIYFEVGSTPETSRVIQRCFGSTNMLASAQSNCEMLGGKWFADHKFGAQCVITPSTGSDDDHHDDDHHEDKKS